MGKFYADKSNRSKIGKKWLWIIPIFLVIVALSSVLYIQNWYYSNLEPLSSSTDEVIVTVAVGATAKEIGVQQVWPLSIRPLN